MKITSITFREHIVPEGCSCGTGYSEPDSFLVMTDDGNGKVVLIDTWYRDKDSWRDCFDEGISLEYDNVENMDEAFEMFTAAILGASEKTPER